MGVDVVRGLLADPDVAVTMRRLVTDPLTGHLLDYGRKTYAGPRPTPRLHHRPRQDLPIPGLPPKGDQLPG